MLDELAASLVVSLGAHLLWAATDQPPRLGQPIVTGAEASGENPPGFGLAKHQVDASTLTRDGYSYDDAEFTVGTLAASDMGPRHAGPLDASHGSPRRCSSSDGDHLVKKNFSMC